MGHPLWSRDTRVFVDTCSLMEEASGTFVEKHLVPLLAQHSTPLIVPNEVVGELDRLANSRKTSTARAARNAKRVVQAALDKGAARVVGEPGDSFPDNLFQAVFTRYRLKYRLILISQDRRLVKDILELNKGASVDRIHGIDAYRIGKHGDPMRWSLDPSHDSGVKYRLPTSRDGFPTVSGARRRGGASRIRNLPKVQPFAERKRASRLTDSVVHAAEIPGEGETIRDANGSPVCLLSALGTGGEGVAYATDRGLVCKVYHRGRLQQFVVEKLKLMTSREVRHPSICWPVSLAYNRSGEPIGYLMPRAEGRELKRSVFIKPLLLQSFPDWNRRHLVRLALSILDSVRYLHSLNVLLGDINARNILVNSESSVYLVDCDSYQVEGFPCPVGMPPYLAPELHGKQLRSTLRTLEHERFAIATLVFMLLHPGKPPYSHQGGEDPSKNVRKQHFPYPLGDQHSEGVPGGPWRFMWSHLPRYMKEAFHKVFSDGERLTVADWVRLLRRYDGDIGRGYVSDEAFPTGFKRLSRAQVERLGAEWRACSSCGCGFGAFKEHHTMCRDCLHKRHSGPRTGSPRASRASASRPSSSRNRSNSAPSRAATPQPARSNPPRPPTPSSPPSQQQDFLSAVMKFLNDMFS